MKKIRNILNRKGVSLIFSILVLLVMSILSVAVFTLFASNIATAKTQQDSVRGHFLAISGVEMSFAAVLDDTDGSSLLVSYFKSNDISSTMANLEDTITLDDGYVDVVVSSYIDEDEGVRYIQINSIGYPDGSTTSVELNMYFNAKFPQIQQWD